MLTIFCDVARKVVSHPLLHVAFYRTAVLTTRYSSLLTNHSPPLAGGPGDVWMTIDVSASVAGPPLPINISLALVSSHLC